MSDPAVQSDLARSFERHEIDTANFHHAEHVEVAFALLKKYDFVDATAIYAKGIRALAGKVGAPQKFNVTITYAFMSLIAERMSRSVDDSFEKFVEENSDLMSREVLAKWYAPERLHSEIARHTFLMPAVNRGNTPA